MPNKSVSAPVNLGVPYQRAFDAVVAALPTIPMTVGSADPSTGLIIGSSGISAASWGEKITVQVWAVDEATSAFTVESKLSFGLVDWGKHKKNIAKVTAAVQAQLGAPPAWG